MQKLIDGIHRFQSGVFGAQRSLFERLASGQAPDTLFITCSDSRISPNLITQTGPGELFVIRNAGNIIPAYGLVCTGEAATIEYAVDVLGVKDIVVCGHSQCGAMKAVLDPTGLEEMPAMSSWLGHAQGTRRIMRAHYRDLDAEHQLSACVKENTLVQIENLRTHPAVLEGLTRGRLALHAWVYRIEHGDVLAFDADEGQFVPLKANAPHLVSPVERMQRSA